MYKFIYTYKNYKYPWKLISIDKKDEEDFNKFPLIRVIIANHNRDGKSTLLCHMCVKRPE